MRHQKAGRHLGRTSSHRLALRRNLAKALFTYGRIITTVTKAKEVKPFVEKLITLARKAYQRKETDRPTYVHYYREILSRLQDGKLTQKLVGEGQWREKGCIGERFLNRNGGYTRIIRLGGSRLGVLTGSKIGKIPVLTYKMEGQERKLRLVGNRLGDNAPLVLFELVEGTGEAGKEIHKPEAEKEEAAAASKKEEKKG
ncbi:MAG TPA: 50S ribosomal protein L17 [Candidatus Hypogeohydataceae bacterium YC41]